MGFWSNSLNALKWAFESQVSALTTRTWGQVLVAYHQWQGQMFPAWEPCQASGCSVSESSLQPFWTWSSDVLWAFVNEFLFWLRYCLGTIRAFKTGLEAGNEDAWMTCHEISTHTWRQMPLLYAHVCFSTDFRCSSFAIIPRPLAIL